VSDLSLSHDRSSGKNHESNSPWLRSGNRCGHHPATPRYFALAPGDKRLSHTFLVAVTVAVTAFYDDPTLFPLLNAANHSKSSRQMRSEARESCVAVVQCLVMHMCIRTMRVGSPGKGGRFSGITEDDLARLTGLSIWRVHRAIIYLKRAGIVSVHQTYEDVGFKDFRGRAAIRVISPAFFVLIGLDFWLADERGRATKKEKTRATKKQAKKKIMDVASMKMAAKALAEKMRGRRRSTRKASESPTTPAESGSGKAMSRGRAKMLLMNEALKQRAEINYADIEAYLDKEFPNEK